MVAMTTCSPQETQTPSVGGAEIFKSVCQEFYADSIFHWEPDVEEGSVSAKWQTCSSFYEAVRSLILYEKVIFCVFSFSIILSIVKVM